MGAKQSAPAKLDRSKSELQRSAVSSIQIAANVQCALGECPLWDGENLWWTDIEGKKVYCMQHETKEMVEFEAPKRVGAFAFMAGPPGRLLCAFEDSVCVVRVDREAKKLVTESKLGDFEPESRGKTRLNDGRVDRAGQFIVGGYNERRKDSPAPCTSVYLVTPNSFDLLEDHSLVGLVNTSNAICFSKDGTRMYFTDTPTNEIVCFDYDASKGTVSNRRSFWKKPDEFEGRPDGAIVDADDHVWCALFSGGRVVRISPDGVIDLTVELPAPNTTCPCIGGPNLDTMFVTTARKGMSEKDLKTAPNAGAVFSFKLPKGIKGLPEGKFRPVGGVLGMISEVTGASLPSVMCCSANRA
eukprot:GDKH01003098.1.p1 GENE.GDKH01003098.1~~GDKH01003098.1.p1  ORF type:complete len:356 (-),score=30.21 GDKH01003098.1:271-1338(-)